MIHLLSLMCQNFVKLSQSCIVNWQHQKENCSLACLFPQQMTFHQEMLHSCCICWHTGWQSGSHHSCWENATSKQLSQGQMSDLLSVSFFSSLQWELLQLNDKQSSMRVRVQRGFVFGVSRQFVSLFEQWFARQAKTVHSWNHMSFEECLLHIPVTILLAWSFLCTEHLGCLDWHMWHIHFKDQDPWKWPQVSDYPTAPVFPECWLLCETPIGWKGSWIDVQCCSLKRHFIFKIFLPWFDLTSWQSVQWDLLGSISFSKRPMDMETGTFLLSSFCLVVQLSVVSDKEAALLALFSREASFSVLVVLSLWQIFEAKLQCFDNGYLFIWGRLGKPFAKEKRVMSPTLCVFHCSCHQNGQALNVGVHMWQRELGEVVNPAHWWKGGKGELMVKRQTTKSVALLRTAELHKWNWSQCSMQFACNAHMVCMSSADCMFHCTHQWQISCQFIFQSFVHIILGDINDATAQHTTLCFRFVSQVTKFHLPRVLTN